MSLAYVAPLHPQVNTWWLLLCCAASTYINWMMEQRARERFARQLGPAGQRQLRHLMQRHPMYRQGRLGECVMGGVV